MVIIDRSRDPKACIHFLGGAFVGATPHLAYPLLLRLVAEAGYTIVCTPYKSTFKQLDCADRTRTDFRTTVRTLEAEGDIPSQLPTFGLGHSNGALLHSLAGSLFVDPTHPDDASFAARHLGDVLMSYNNRSINDAVPIPGFLNNISPIADALENAGVRPLDLQGVLGGLQALAPGAPWGNIAPNQVVADLQPAFDQIPENVDEIRKEGLTDFVPSPQDSMALIGSQYRIPATLLVRFQGDPIDQSPQLRSVLLASGVRSASQHTLLEVPGSHVTPCTPDPDRVTEAVGGADLPWLQKGTATGAAWASLGASSSRDVRRVAKRITDFYDRVELLRLA